MEDEHNLDEKHLVHLYQSRLLNEIRSLQVALTTADNLRLNLERSYSLKKGRKAWAYGFKANYERLRPPCTEDMGVAGPLPGVSYFKNSTMHDLLEVILWRRSGNDIEVASVRNGSIHIAKLKEYHFTKQIHTSLKDALVGLHSSALGKTNRFSEYLDNLNGWKNNLDVLVVELELSIQQEEILDITGKVAEASKLLDSLIAKDGSV